MNRSRINCAADRALTQKGWSSRHADDENEPIPLPMILETLERIYSETPDTGIALDHMPEATEMIQVLARLGYLDDNILHLIRQILAVNLDDIPRAGDYMMSIANFLRSLCSYNGDNIMVIIQHTNFSMQFGKILSKISATWALKDLLTALLNIAMNCGSDDPAISDSIDNGIYTGLCRVYGYRKAVVRNGCETTQELSGYEYAEDVSTDDQYNVCHSLAIQCMAYFMVKFSLVGRSKNFVINMKHEICPRENQSLDILMAAFESVGLCIEYKVDDSDFFDEEFIKALTYHAYTEGDIANGAIKVIAKSLKGTDQITSALVIPCWCACMVNNHPQGLAKDPEDWVRNWLTIWYEIIRHAFLMPLRSLWRYAQTTARESITSNVQTVADSLAEFIVIGDFDFNSAAMLVVAVMIGSGNDTLASTTYTALKEKGINIIEGLCNIIQSQEHLSELAIALAWVASREMTVGIDDATQQELLTGIEVLTDEDPSQFTENGREAVMWLTQNCSA